MTSVIDDAVFELALNRSTRFTRNVENRAAHRAINCMVDVESMASPEEAVCQRATLA